MSAIFGENRDIFFPKLSEKLHLITFSEIAVKYLEAKGYEPYLCKNEEEAREFFTTSKFQNLKPKSKYWPCLFTPSDTTGEKDFEEFFTDKETLDMDRFENLGIIKNELDFNAKLLQEFEETIRLYKQKKSWSKEDIVRLFFKLIPDFGHKEMGKYLDEKM
jgi:hypothetical protein